MKHLALHDPRDCKLAGYRVLTEGKLWTLGGARLRSKSTNAPAFSASAYPTLRTECGCDRHCVTMVTETTPAVANVLAFFLRPLPEMATTQDHHPTVCRVLFGTTMSPRAAG